MLNVRSLDWMIFGVALFSLGLSGCTNTHPTTTISKDQARNGHYATFERGPSLPTPTLTPSSSKHSNNIEVRQLENTPNFSLRVLPTPHPLPSHYDPPRDNQHHLWFWEISKVFRHSGFMEDPWNTLDPPHSQGSPDLGLRARVQMAKATPGIEPNQQGTVEKGPDLELLAKKAANPLSDLWLLWAQNDISFLQGDALPEDKILNSFKFQPIMPVPLFGGAWNFLIRPIIQIQSVPLDNDVGKLFGVNGDTIVEDEDLAQIAADPFGRTTGLGDSVLLTLVGPNKIDGVVWGVGASQIFPTATNEVLGQEKWQAGPAVLLARMGKNPGDFNFGLLPQHWWSYAGDDDRPETSLTDIQYFINYKANTTALVGMAPNIRINWKADKSKNKYTVPVGLGYNDMAFMGKVPFRYGVEMQYSVIRPDNVGTKWNIRIYFIPIIPNLLKS